VGLGTLEYPEIEDSGAYDVTTVLIRRAPYERSSLQENVTHMSSNAPPLTPLTPGDWVDRYELLYPVAQGGMGAVWAARVQSMNGFEKLFAIKLILAQYASRPEFRSMFLDEARISAGIAHPNVAQVIDLGEQNGLLYIVMEWLDGDSINVLHREAVSRQALLPLAMVLRLAADACDGLHAAHELRDQDGVLLDVVHRDISPQNLFVTGSGVLKVIDFGIAKARHRINETTAGVLKGKIHYMAPEQASGLEIDRRADVWSIGSLLYYLTTGRHAYDGPNEVATLHALLSPQGRSPMPSTVPQPIAAIIDKAMTFDPSGRYATAIDMKAAIESAMDILGLKATTGTIETYCRERLSPRFTARKQSLSLGKRAAEERGRMRRMLEQRVMVQVGSSSRVGQEAVRARAPQASPALPIEAAGIATMPPSVMQQDETKDGISKIDETLASGVLTAPSPSSVAAKNRTIWVGAVGLMVTLLIMLALQRPSHPSAQAALGASGASFLDVRPSTSSINIERHSYSDEPSPSSSAMDSTSAVQPPPKKTTPIPSPTAEQGIRSSRRAPVVRLPPPAPKSRATDSAIEDRK
jgi:serine/threonine protein kinase